MRDLAKQYDFEPFDGTRAQGFGGGRSEAERDIALDWGLTAETCGTAEFWRALFAEAGYTDAHHRAILQTDLEWSVVAGDDGATAGKGV